MSKSHQRKTFKRIKKQITPEYLEKLMITPTIMKGETIRFGTSKFILELKEIFFRVGCLPYSQHARATAKTRPDGGVEYSDWWGYEIDMIELMAAKHNFSIIYDPPEDGLWGALEASGNMSGLIGQAAYNEVDVVLSGVMTTRDR